MQSGVYYNPTTIFFGKGMELRVGEETAKYSRNILLHYGSNSLKKHGVYDRVVLSLKEAGVGFVELGGVKPNPRANLVYEGIDLCRKHSIDFILAAGGGSVIDSAKAISIGVPYYGDFLDFFERKQTPDNALRLATILTLAGSGSETSKAATIESKGSKLVCSYQSLAPLFSILNPELTYTVNEFNTMSGIVDAISHVFERYFTNEDYVDCTDRIGEGLIRTLMKYAFLVKEEPDNYNVRAEIMWACKLAHDETAGFGRKQDWSSHTISHELGAKYDLPHGALMGVIFPAWMKYVYRTNGGKLLQLARGAFDVDTVQSMIEKLQWFLETMNMPLSLRDMGVTTKPDFSEIAKKCVRYMPSGTIGNFVRLSPYDIVRILEIAY